MTWETQTLPEFKAISSRVLLPMEPVAWRSSRAEARKAVAVRAARETRARTLIRAKLGELRQSFFWEKFFMGILVFGTIDFKFEGAGIFLNISRVHPSGVRNFLGCILRVKGEFDPHFVSLIKSRVARSLVAEVEAVHDQTATCVGAPIDSDLKVAGVTGEDFTVGGNVGEESGGSGSGSWESGSWWKGKARAESGAGKSQSGLIAD